MKNFWVTYKDGTTGSCQGMNDYDAKAIAEKIKEKEVESLYTLPYPAMPVIWKFDHPVHGECPSFCYTPELCVGKSSCPHQRACSE